MRRSELMGNVRLRRTLPPQARFYAHTGHNLDSSRTFVPQAFPKSRGKRTSAEHPDKPRKIQKLREAAHDDPERQVTPTWRSTQIDDARHCGLRQITVEM